MCEYLNYKSILGHMKNDNVVINVKIWKNLAITRFFE